MKTQETYNSLIYSIVGSGATTRVDVHKVTNNLLKYWKFKHRNTQKITSLADLNSEDRQISIAVLSGIWDMKKTKLSEIFQVGRCTIIRDLETIKVMLPKSKKLQNQFHEIYQNIIFIELRF